MKPRLLATHMGELVRELSPLCIGATLRDVQPLPPRDLLLILEPPAEPGGDASRPPLRVRVSIDRDAPRVHLQQGRVHTHKGPEGKFFQGLRKELAGARLHSIEQVRGDRIVLFEFRDTPGGGRRALLAELTGGHGNLALLERDDRVLDLLVAPRTGKGGAAPRLEIGRAWEPPGGRAGAPPREEPTIEEAFDEPSELPPSGRLRAPLSWRVECALGARAAEGRRDELLRSLRARCKRKLARAHSQLAGLERKRDAAERAERVRMDGELLLGAQGVLKRGMAEAVVQDWFEDGAPERRIPLAKELSPSENAERLFARYRKLVRSAENVGEEIERARERLTALEDLAERVEREDADPEALEREALDAGLLEPAQEADPRKKKAPEPRKPYKSFFGLRGSEIRVGRTARDNDTLTIRITRGSDVWFHTADAPGSHVVLRLERGAEPDPEEILDAAHLAVHFSPLRGTDRASVHQARRKHIHKPRGAKPGLVSLSGGKILELRIEQKRIDRLLRSTAGK